VYRARPIVFEGGDPTEAAKVFALCSRVSAKRDRLNYQTLLGHVIEATSNRYLRGRDTAVVQPLNRRTEN